jgi:hypothetical protein
MEIRGARFRLPIGHCYAPPMRTLTRIRFWLVLFVLGLILSGVTAFPLEAGSGLLVRLLHADWSPAPEHLPALVDWIDWVHHGIAQTNQEYPFMAYGTDWLAFAHLVIAVAFWVQSGIRYVTSGLSTSG